MSMKQVVYLAFFFLSLPLQAQFSEKWGDQGDGTYCNPVLPGDFSDIDAIRVGSDFYAITSTFQYSPGVAVLHSKDLVNWEILSHVVNDVTQISPEMNWDKMNRYGTGIWAGSIRYYKNKYWVYFGTPDEGFFMSSASKPEGPWEPLHCLMPAKGWDDCCSFMDDDGQLYFIATHFAMDTVNGKKYNIHLFKMSSDGKSLLAETDTIIHQSNGSEANKLYKINGSYYHYFSEVKKEGRVVMMERSKSLKGPWEIKQLNHVNKDLDREPNQGGLIELENGNWWFFTHHGSGNSFEGRTASLLPITWMNGWPIIGSVGADSIGNMIWQAQKPITTPNKIHLQTNDDFSKDKLAAQWEWNYQPRSDKWSLNERKGYLRLYAFEPLRPTDPKQIVLRAGNTLTQRSMRTPNCEATVKMDVSHMANGQFAGLTHYSTKSHSLFGIRQTNNKRELVLEINGKETSVKHLKCKTIYFRSTWGLDDVGRYAYSLNDKDYTLLDPTHQFTWGSYRGDRVGIFNYNILADKGFVDLDWFNYTMLSK
jgi:beta-xylosidase